MSGELLWLDDPRATDPTLVGRKAWSLATLRGIEGILIPPGVVIGVEVEPITAAAGVVAAFGPIPLAVRSSALDEDDAEASNAGRYLTVLDVVGEGAVSDAIEQVRHAVPDRPPVPVLVMPMLRPEAAGVAFSTDPVTGDDRVVVEAVPGLADGLVAGKRNPERWWVDYRGDAVRLGGPAVLSREQAAEVAALAVLVSDHRGVPQDIEWVLAADGTLHLLQARPITAMPVVPAIDEPPAGETWRRVDEAFGRPLRALEFSSWAPLAEEATARAFATVGVPLERSRFRWIGGWVYSRLVPLVDTGRDDQPPPGRLLAAIGLRLIPSLRRRMRTATAFWRSEPDQTMVAEWERRGRAELRARTLQLRRVDRSSLSMDALATHLGDVLAHLGRTWDVHAMLPACSTFLALGRLGVLCEELLRWTPVQTLQLVSGYATPVGDRGEALKDLAVMIAGDPSARRILERQPDQLEALDSAGGEALRAFLDEHGHQAVGGGLAYPTWAEDPAPVLALVRAQLEASGRDGHQAEALARTAECQAEELLAGRPEDIMAFRTALFQARAVASYGDETERHVHEAMALVRYAAREIGRRLHEGGALTEVDDVMHLDVDELRAAVRTGDVTVDVERRRAEHRWALAHRGPGRYGPMPVDAELDLRWAPRRVREFLKVMQWVTRHLQPPIDESVPHRVVSRGLTGIAASVGTAVGPVRVVRDPTEFTRLRPGDVLVCSGANGSWSVVLPLVSAIVTEIGGPLAHPAVLAREAGVPAVVGVPGATAHLTEGTLVEVDGAAGTVRQC